MLLTIRGPIIFEAVFNPKIRLICEDWDDLILHEFHDPGVATNILRYIAEIPAFQERGRNMKVNASADDSLISELYDRLLVLRLTLDKARRGLQEFEKTEYEPGLLHLTYQRMYGLAMMPTLLYNCMLRGLNAAIELQSEAELMVHETIQLAQKSHVYRPLGASYICLCLVLAIAASTNCEDRLQAEDLLGDYCRDFPGLQTMCEATVLNKTTRFLQLDYVQSAKEVWTQCG